MKSLQLSVLAALMFACGSSSDKKTEVTNQTSAETSETSQDAGAAAQTTESTTENTAPANGNADAGKSDGNNEGTDVSKPTPAEVIAFEVNATDKTKFAGFDLDGNKAVADITSDLSWDLAFKRTSVKVQNPAVTVATIKGKTFDEVTEVPADAEFVSDAPVEGSETAGLVFHAGDAWYSYDMDTHVISSRNLVYLVKSSEGNIYKIALTDYYNGDRLSGYIQVKSQLLKAAE